METNGTVKIMLKGAAQYSDVDEIYERVKKAEQEKRPLRIKYGMDPSAPDIHIGHAVPLRKLRQMQDIGHEAVIILGDYTGMIGDPSGKSKTRSQLSHAEVLENAKTYEEQIFRILDMDKTTVRFNGEWFGSMLLKDVIELCSKSTVARIMERDDFKNRFENGQSIGVHELLYPLMQAYDSVAVEADIELGGTDQMFNILMGRNVQRDYGQTPQLVLFMPLLEGIDGVEKMSKSLGNYVGIYEDAADMFVKLMKIPDSLIIKYYELCTDIHPDEVDKIKVRLSSGANPRDIKLDLAKEIITLYHGSADAQNAMESFITAYSRQEVPPDAPTLHLPCGLADDLPVRLIDCLMASGRYKSKSDVRRLFQQGAVKINGEKITELNTVSGIADGTVIQIGKGNFYIIKEDNDNHE